jgi:hypothetical protein
MTLKYQKMNYPSKLKMIYLAVPYSGIEGSSYRQVTVATAKLMMQYVDINVFSPITHSHPLTQFGLKGDWEFWKEIDTQFLSKCDEMWVLIPDEGLDKVYKSIGVQEEIKIATQLGIPVKFLTKFQSPGTVVYHFVELEYEEGY